MKLVNRVMKQSVINVMSVLDKVNWMNPEEVKMELSKNGDCKFLSERGVIYEGHVMDVLEEIDNDWEDFIKSER